MKLWRLVLVVLTALILFTVVGCGSDAKAPIQEDAASVAGGQQVVMPQEQPGLTGKVKDIVGNEVTVFKGEINQTPNQTQKRMEFSEETETFMIPVGTPIVTVQRGNNAANRLELTDIKKDTVLRIWKEDDMVKFVHLMGGGGPGTRQGAENTGDGTGSRFVIGPAGGMGGNRQP